MGVEISFREPYLKYINPISCRKVLAMPDFQMVMKKLNFQATPAAVI